MTLPKRIAVTLPSGPRVQDTLDRAHRAKDQGYPDARLVCRQRRCVWLVGQGDGAPTARAVNDELVDQIAIIGSADCRMRIKAGMPAGIRTQIIALSPARLTRRPMRVSPPLPVGNSNSRPRPELAPI